MTLGLSHVISRHKSVFRNEPVPFSMAIENVVLVHECYSEHFRVGTAGLSLV